MSTNSNDRIDRISNNQENDMYGINTPEITRDKLASELAQLFLTDEGLRERASAYAEKYLRGWSQYREDKDYPKAREVVENTYILWVFSSIAVPFSASPHWPSFQPDVEYGKGLHSDFDCDCDDYVGYMQERSMMVSGHSGDEHFEDDPDTAGYVYFEAARASEMNAVHALAIMHIVKAINA